MNSFSHRTHLLHSLACACLLALAPVSQATVVNFDTFADSTPLTTQVSGATFTDATVLMAGVSLNEAAFPPHSGTGVVTDSGGAMSITFDDAQSSVSGYFTYLVPMTLTAFDGANQLLGTVHSQFASNNALSGASGSTPNEFLSLDFQDIRRVEFQGSPVGSSFVLDDLAYAPSALAPIPEPTTAVLVALSLATLIARKRAAR